MTVDLVDVGQTRLYEDDFVRVWEVSLDPGECHSWHLHRNPYVVLSLEGGEGRMDWLDGSPPRFISEYRGGAVYRPVSPVHRLTNIGETPYRNRLIELKDLGEHREGPLDIGDGGRSVRGEVVGPPTADGRQPVLLHPDVSIWTLSVPGQTTRELDLQTAPHVLAWIDPAGDVFTANGESVTVLNPAEEERALFVVRLSYLL